MRILLFVTCGLVALLGATMKLRAEPASRLPKVLFFANPMQSDNDVIRRTTPDQLSVAEARFAELSKGIFDVTFTQDGNEVSKEKLSRYDAVIFFTALNPPGVDRAGLIEWVREGGAFVGIHSAANTFQDYAPFGEMLGAYYDRRPWRTRETLQTAVRIEVRDRTHPATQHLPEEFEIADDIYQFKNFDPATVKLLLSLDPASLDLENPRVNREDAHFPVSWVKSHGQGRVFYTSLGDWEPTWRNRLFQEHLLQGIQWAMKKVNGG